jgi:hypothetical protein
LFVKTSLALLLVSVAVLGCAQMAPPPRTTDLDAAESAADWGYDVYLQLFQEPDLLDSASKESDVVYRLFVIPTFTNPFMIKVKSQGAEYLVTSKVLSGQGGYDPGHLQVVRERFIAPRDWHRFQGFLQKASFWLLPSEDTRFKLVSKGDGVVCLDGSTWLLEGLEKGQYHIVERYCPQLPKFESCGHFLLKISRLEIAYDDMY